MQDVEIIGMLKSYIKKTLVGMGALKGAPCTVKEITTASGDHTVTLEWEDSEGVKHNDDFTVSDGFSPTIVVKTSSDSTYILTITDKNGSYDTPNLKGGGGGGGSSTLADLTDVVLTSLAAGDLLVYDAVNGKWINSDVLSDLAEKATTLAGYGITDAYTKTETDNAITAEIEKLDASDSAVAGSYVTAVSEADGKISVTREAADASPTENSNKMVKSGGVYTELAKKADKVTGATNGNFAGLDANGNLTDSGKKAADFATAQALADEAATRSAMGAKNLLPFDLAKIKAENTAGIWNNNEYTVNGVTFTLYTDAANNLVNVKATGTAEADATLMIYGKSYTTADDIVFSDSVIASTAFAGSSTTARAIVWGTQSGYIDADELTIAAFTFYGFGLRVINGYEIPEDGIVFKPMIRLATDANADYQPFAKTNKQLTDEQGYITEAQWTAINALYA